LVFKKSAIYYLGFVDRPRYQDYIRDESKITLSYYRVDKIKYVYYKILSLKQKALELYFKKI